MCYISVPLSFSCACHLMFWLFFLPFSSPQTLCYCPWSRLTEPLMTRRSDCWVTRLVARLLRSSHSPEQETETSCCCSDKKLFSSPCDASEINNTDRVIFWLGGFCLVSVEAFTFLSVWLQWVTLKSLYTPPHHGSVSVGLVCWCQPGSKTVTDKQAGWSLAEMKHSPTTPSAYVNKNDLLIKINKKKTQLNMLIDEGKNSKGTT